MEQTKVKTDDLNLVIKLMSVRSNTYDMFGRKPLAWERSFLNNLTAAGIYIIDSDMNSHIANLEAQNKELREALEKIYSRAEHFNMKHAHNFHLDMYNISKEALKEGCHNG